MKKIGIIGAMQEEIESLVKSLSEVRIENLRSLKFYVGSYENHELIVVRCGVGKVNAAMCTQALIDQYKPDYIINVGVAGAIADKVDIGDIVLSTYLVEHDFDCTAFGYEKGSIPRMRTSKFSADKKLLSIAKKSQENFSQIRFFEGVIASGDVFVSSKELKDSLKQAHGAMCAEMEGAAIAHVCYLNEMPFLVIRSMSDRADGGAPSNFNEFVKESAEISSAFIQKMIVDI